MGKLRNFRAARVSDLNFEDLYDEISADLDSKINNLLQRRERKLRDNLRAGFDGAS